MKINKISSNVNTLSERELIFPSYVVFTFLANLISKRTLFFDKRKPPFESNITSQVRFQNDPLLKTETLFEENMSFVHEIRLLENERVKNVKRQKVALSSRAEIGTYLFCEKSFQKGFLLENFVLVHTK